MKRNKEENSMLKTLRAAEEANADITTKLLGDLPDLVQMVGTLYDWIVSELSKPGGVEKCPEAVPGVQFLRASQYYLHTAVLSCLRCHLTDSFAPSRMAIESAALLAKVKRQPTLAKIWLEAGTDTDQAKIYRRESIGPELFPKEDPQLTALKAHYDLCAKQTHPGFVSMARRLRLPKDAPPLSSEFHWFEVPPGSRAEPARTVFWIIDTHVKLLDLYASIFEPGLDAQGWQLRRNNLDAGFLVQGKKWLPDMMRHEGWYLHHGDVENAGE